MYQYKKVTEDMYWIGGNDRRIALFESAYPVSDGVSYNSYFVDDEKTVVLDTVDWAVSGVYTENIDKLLNGRKLDFLIVNHMEPDHSAMISEIMKKYPEAELVCNNKTEAMVKQFLADTESIKFRLVKEGDKLNTGRHTFTFVMAPMVHWPEVMVTYDITDKILYSADAFGTFGALSGNIFADEVDFENKYEDEARRYYTNIVGKYGTQVQALLKKASAIEISMLCPLHGPVHRKNINWFVDKYQKWSTYTPESNEVMIAYSSIYGHTENAVYILANALSDKGLKVKMYDTSVTHPSIIVAESFRCSHLVFASPTYNAGIFSSMETLLLDLKAHFLKNRTVALIENGSWAPVSGSLMKNIISSMKDMTIIENTVTIKSSVKEADREELLTLAEKIAETMPKAKEYDESKVIEPNAMFKISYGLYVLSAKDGKKENGCIINTVMQITNTPKKISISVNKSNLTHDMIQRTGIFNVSVLSESADFSVFKHFGFVSGRDIDKFEDYKSKAYSENGLIYLVGCTNAYISAKVISSKDCGTHTEFLAEVTEAKVLSSVPSMTYQYYFDNVKPKPQPVKEQKKGFICKICGYIYEGDTLPADFICPLCKHGAEDFEPITL